MCGCAPFSTRLMAPCLHLTRYSTSIVGNRTVEFIKSALSAKPRKPFLAVAATRAPHGPSTPAPWYEDALPDAKNRVTPAFNYSAVGHVPWVADLPPLSGERKRKCIQDKGARTACAKDCLPEQLIQHCTTPLTSKKGPRSPVGSHCTTPPCNKGRTSTNGHRAAPTNLSPLALRGRGP